MFVTAMEKGEILSWKQILSENAAICMCEKLQEGKIQKYFLSKDR